MKTILIYNKKSDLTKDPPMIRYVRNRLKKNQNFMMIITGKTGSGKTYFGMSFAEALSKHTGRSFTVDNIAFDLEEWIRIVREAPRHSIILFDEPQISISSKAAMSRANRIFNYIASTFRVKNLIVIFCTPYEDFIDKSARKLIHSKVSMSGLDIRAGIATAKPVLTEWTPYFQRIQEQFIRTYHNYPENVGSKIKKYVQWSQKKPSHDLIEAYEKKKIQFLDNLLAEAEDEVKKLTEAKKKTASPRKKAKNS